MDITTETYQVTYDDTTQTIIFHGSLRLSGMEEYTPIIDLLHQIADQRPTSMSLDLRNLQFLNSSGINVLSKFVIRVRQYKNIALFIIGSKDIPWQGKSLKNLQRLMPQLQLEWE
ncbi:hypothetical protein PN462_04600 [Spirulina sp. CS-785/01]|uniref:slr1659 superfamily regulator n=1 Tax=Spirulina sp. CS-785/01 TaxID=3021716 RepID=UPI00232B7048|nr:hypothetical protein [Spirulina sp. CS-785/01]MDB9312374.1 hypothetical protein [Spirulina sp. CS-785/01]